MTAPSQAAIPPEGREIQTSEALARFPDRCGQGEIERSRRVKFFARVGTAMIGHRGTFEAAVVTGTKFTGIGRKGVRVARTGY